MWVRVRIGQRVTPKRPWPWGHSVSSFRRVARAWRCRPQGSRGHGLAVPAVPGSSGSPSTRRRLEQSPMQLGNSAHPGGLVGRPSFSDGVVDPFTSAMAG